MGYFGKINFLKWAVYGLALLAIVCLGTAGIVGNSETNTIAQAVNVDHIASLAQSIDPVSKATADTLNKIALQEGLLKAATYIITLLVGAIVYLVRCIIKVNDKVTSSLFGLSQELSKRPCVYKSDRDLLPSKEHEDS
jgi:hypothetical protein